MAETARSSWLSAFAMICLTVAGCGGFSTPTSDGLRTSRITGGPDLSPTGASKQAASGAQFNPLSADEAQVILGKGTERAFTGQYTDLKDLGTYVCRRCNAPLNRSDDKFSPANAGGPASTTRLREQSRRCPTATAFAPRSSAGTVAGISGTTSWEKVSRRRTRVTA